MDQSVPLERRERGEERGGGREATPISFYMNEFCLRFLFLLHDRQRFVRSIK